MKNKIILAFVVVFFTLLGCSFEPYDAARAKPIAGDQHEYLALLKAADEYTVSEERLEEMITRFLNQKSGERAVAGKNIKITGSKRLPITRRKKPGARSVADEQDPVDVYVFSTENPSSGTEGYVLASTDMRIGNILAVVDGKALEDEEEWFTDIIFEGIEGHIERTISEYASIDAEEIQQILETPSATRVVLPPGTSGSGSVHLPQQKPGLVHLWWPDAPLVAYACWTWTDGYDASVPVQWDQGNPYNYYVCRSRNGALDDYVTGCGPTAIAQVMAYHGWPLQCNLSVTIPNVNLNIYNYTYNWASMRNAYCGGVTLPNPITGGEKDIAVLMYQIGHPQRGNATYTKKNGATRPTTSITQVGALTAFLRMGYTVPTSFIPYNYTFIENSVGLGRPVLVCGSEASNGGGGHMWVIDGVRRMSYEEWFGDGSGMGFIWYGGWEWVHCNLGWSGGSDAWYINGIFDTREQYLSSVQNTVEYYYQYNIKIAPDIRPN